MEKVRVVIDDNPNHQLERFVKFSESLGEDTSWYYKLLEKESKKAERKIRRQNRRELREKKRLSRKNKKTRHSTTR